MTSRPSVGPSVGLVLIGDELLSGAVPDTNGPHLIQRLRALGARLRRVVMVGDDVEEIAAAVSATAAACDLVCTTGGIGPTHDDVTIDGVAQALGLPVLEDPRIVAWMRERLGRAPSTAHRRMARVPEGAEIVVPAPGPGPGAPPTLVVRNVVVLPGVPSLMRACFTLVEDRFRGAPRWHQAVEVTAHEAALAEPLRALAAAHPRVRVGSYPRAAQGAGDDDGVRTPWTVRLTAEGDAREDVVAAARAIAKRFGALGPVVEPLVRLGPLADGPGAAPGATGRHD